MDDVIGKLLPPFMLMRTGLMGPDGERRIQQEDTLPAPPLQVTRCWNRPAQVITDLLVDIDERRGNIHSVVDRETQSIGLARFVIGILTYNDHFYLIKRTLVECVENQLCRWIDCSCGILLADKIGQCLEIGFFKLVT